jgi:cytochrome c
MTLSTVRRAVFTGLVLTAWTALALAEPVDGGALAIERRCNACHDVERVLLGPSYRSVAARYAGREDVMTDVLAQKIIEGGGGNWGLVPMVPNEHVSFEEARRIAEWVLALD